MNKKQIIIMAGVGLIFFGLSFTVGLFTRKPEVPPVVTETPGDAEKVEDLTKGNNVVAAPGPDGIVPSTAFQPKQADLGKSLTQKQLNSLVFEMRSKLAEFESKEKTLLEKEGRIQMSIDELQKNIIKMEELRVKLAATVTSIKQQQKILAERLIKIDTVEKINITKTASIYDVMKAAEASEIMIKLAESNQLDYVVKIAYYMKERTSAKLIAEISKDQPILAATISDRLRWIDEVKP